MSMMQTYKNILTYNENSHETRDAVIHGKDFRVLEQCRNDYRTDQLEFIPAGTVINADFAGDFGVYATAEIRGVIHKVKIDTHELHKIHWGEFDARKDLPTV